MGYGAQLIANLMSGWMAPKADMNQYQINPNIESDEFGNWYNKKTGQAVSEDEAFSGRKDFYDEQGNASTPFKKPRLLSQMFSPELSGAINEVNQNWKLAEPTALRDEQIAHDKLMQQFSRIPSGLRPDVDPNAVPTLTGGDLTAGGLASTSGSIADIRAGIPGIASQTRTSLAKTGLKRAKFDEKEQDIKQKIESITNELALSKLDKVDRNVLARMIVEQEGLLNRALTNEEILKLAQQVDLNKAKVGAAITEGDVQQIPLLSAANKFNNVRGLYGSVYGMTPEQASSSPFLRRATEQGITGNERNPSYVSELARTMASMGGSMPAVGGALGTGINLSADQGADPLAGLVNKKTGAPVSGMTTLADMLGTGTEPEKPPSKTEKKVSEMRELMARLQSVKPTTAADIWSDVVGIPYIKQGIGLQYQDAKKKLKKAGRLIAEYNPFDISDRIIQ